MTKKILMFLIIAAFFQISQISSIASEAYLDDVIVDVDSFNENPWNIFGVYIDADTPSYDICENVTSKIHFYNFASHVEMDNSSMPWKVCGPDFHPNVNSYAFDPLSIDDNSNGFFACSNYQLTGNSFVDSYDYSLDPTGNSNNSGAVNIYCNGYVSIEGSAYVRGNVTAHEIVTNGAGFVEGEQLITDKQWDCMTDMIDELRSAASVNNNNSNIGPTSSGQSPFSPEGSLNFCLSRNDEITLEEGIYYFETLNLNGNSSLNFNGKVIIFCEGTIMINGKAELNFSGNPNNVAIYSFTDDIEILGNSKVFSQLYAVQGLVSIKGSSEFFGKIFADNIYFSDNARIHFNTFDSNKFLQFSVTYIYDEQGNIVGQKINVFTLVTKKIIIWKIVVENGNYHRYILVNDQWVHQNRLILKGYGDYNLICDYRPLEHIIIFELPDPTQNLFKIALTNSTKRLNFVRNWANNWTTERKTDADIGNFPWTCTGTRSFDNKILNIYNHSAYVIPPTSTPGSQETWHYYINRLARVLDDAFKYGVVAEIDFFDNSMMKGNYEWNFNPYNPANQFWKNELTGSFLGNASPVSYGAIGWPANGPAVFGTSYPTNYFFWGADHGGAGYQHLAILGEQQKYLVQTVASAASSYRNVVYEPINEPYYAESYGNETSEWHKQINNWVLAVDPDAHFGINMLDGPNLGIWESLIDIVGKVPGLEVISYHAPFWTDFNNCTNWISTNGGLKWSHNLHFNSKVCLIDDDGTWLCRAYNSNVYNWAYEAFSSSYRIANFTHKDYFWNYDTNAFEIDDLAIDAIYNAWTNAGAP